MKISFPKSGSPIIDSPDGALHPGPVDIQYDKDRLPGVDDLRVWAQYNGGHPQQAIYMNNAGPPSNNGQDWYSTIEVPKDAKTYRIYLEGYRFTGEDPSPDGIHPGASHFDDVYDNNGG